MRSVGLFLFVFLETLRSLSAKHTEATLSMLDQLDDLKQKVRNKIYLKRPPIDHQYTIRKHPDELDNSLEYYEYVDEESGSRLQPILAGDQRKEASQGSLRLLKTTKRPDAQRQLPVMRRGLANDTGPSELARKTAGARRNYYSKFPELRDQELSWVHGKVLITPFLTGTMGDSLQKEYYTVGMKDHTFLRFMQLLHHNTTGSDVSDVRTILVQISNLKLRLFLWQVEAIMILLNELIHGTQHTFSHLKMGLKRLFRNWHLDTSATETLLKESRMFRPPCINWRPGGSTKQHSRMTLTPPAPRSPRPPCPRDDESCKRALRNGDAVPPDSGTVEGLTTKAPITEPRASDEETEKTEGEDESDTKPNVDRTVIEWLNPRAGQKDRKGPRAKTVKHHHHKSRG